MAFDTSIYDRVGQVNLGAGLSSLLNEQRQREATVAENQLRLSALTQQGQLAQQQAQEAKRAARVKRGQELNIWLSNAVQSGRPMEEVMKEALAYGSEIEANPEDTQRHVMSVYQNAQTPETRSQFAFTQAYPELVAKQRAESMFRKPEAEKPISWTTVQTESGMVQVNPQTGEIRQLGLQAPAKEKPVNWATLQTDKGIVQVNPQTGEIRELGVQAPPKGPVKGQVTPEQIEQNSLSAQQALDQANKLLQHPGRLAATGASSFLSKIPGTEAKGFAANLDTFKAQTFLPMVSALKGMGALSDAEGKKIADSVGALDPSMPEAEFEQSLKDTMDFLYKKAKAAGLNVVNPLGGDATTSEHPADIQELLNKHK